MSTNMRSLEGGDIEAGSFNGHLSDTEGNISPVEAQREKMTETRNKDSNIVDIDELASYLESMLHDVPHYMCSTGNPGRITRIPENLREVDIKSYEPCFLSLGPYHYGKPNVEHMQKKKWVVLKCFLDQRPELKLKDFLTELKSIEPAARSFYSDVEMQSEKFVEMLLLDSLYVVVIFCGMTRTDQTNTINWSSMDNEDMYDDRINQLNESIEILDDRENTQMVDGPRSGEDYRHTPRWFWTIFMHDLLLLENQLPFFVIQKMHDLTYGGSDTQLIVTITHIFQHLLLEYVKVDSETVVSPKEEVHHLLHLCHMFFRPTIQQDLITGQLPESSQMFRLGSAIQLYEAGVHFEAKSYSSQQSLLDITFNSSGKMAIPSLHVDDNTTSLLRNLIALEQMKYPSLGLDVSAYAVLLLHLITTPEDVKLLRRKGIIQHHLASDKEMMYLVNRLSVGLSFDYSEDKYSLKPVFQELKRYSDHRVPRWKAWLKHKYFTNPWTTISLLAASLLLILTALQTYYSVYSFYYPCFDCH